MAFFRRSQTQRIHAERGGPARGRSRRHRAGWLLNLLVTIVAGFVPGPAFGAEASAPFTGPRDLAGQATPAPVGVGSEVDELVVVPIDPAADPEATMRQRPFILAEGAYAAFDQDQVRSPLTREAGRVRLRELLDQRGVGSSAIESALTRYDDPAVERIVPTPSLRVALLMTTGWDPYEPTIAAILDGANPSGRPFDSVRFGETKLDGAVAIVQEVFGTTRLIVDRTYGTEPPEVLMNVIVHEALHGGGHNSVEEETIATILDTVAYADVLLHYPAVATLGTPLSAFNNAMLLALLNSFGAAGPTQLGISDSALGDVWVGKLLNDIDAHDMREAVAGDNFYRDMASGGSEGQATLTAQLARFPGAGTLGELPPFDEQALRVIDHGIGEILPPADVVRLATLLGLDATAAVAEGTSAADLPLDPKSALASRPFVPRTMALFDRALATVPERSIGGDEARASLAMLEAIDRDVASDARERFDDPALEETIPEPSLRAAALLLDGLPAWRTPAGIILDGEISIAFGALPYGVPVALRADDATRVIVNDALAAEAPGVVATYLVEGMQLSPSLAATASGTAQATIQTVLGTLAWADLIETEPSLAAAGTLAATERNLELLALLNSTAKSSAGAESSVGIRAASSAVGDVLPGLYADPESFASFVATGSRSGSIDAAASFVASPTLVRLLGELGVDPEPIERAPKSEAVLAALDAGLAPQFPPERVLNLARTLDLGASTGEVAATAER
jgi:hypothetical protein